MVKKDSYRDSYGGCFAGKRRSKVDWASISFRDAFKTNLDYSVRLSAQRQYFRLCRAIQLAVVRHINASSKYNVPKVKPQIGPAYTCYPSALAVTASLGLTAFLEFRRGIKERILSLHLRRYLENPSVEDRVNVDPQTYRKIVLIVTENVQARLIFEDLSRLPAAGAIEMYRLFLATQETLLFQSVPEIIRTTVLFGDLLPDWSAMDLNPKTKDVFQNITLASAPFFKELSQTKPQYLIHLGSRWVRAICRSLTPFLPPPETENKKTAEKRGYFKQSWFFSKIKRTYCEDKVINLPPLNARRPPNLFEDVCSLDMFAKAYGMANKASNSKKREAKKKEEKDPMQRACEIINILAQSIDQAGGQSKKAEDLRSDLVENAFRTSGFKEGPIQGNPSGGHTVTVSLGKGQKYTGDIYDRAMELSDDFTSLEHLMETSRPIAEQLRRTLYPNLTPMPEMERIRSSGALDPVRLPLGDVCPAVFRRYRTDMHSDHRRKPVLLIACDGSGSLYREPTRMLKNLTCAWLQATLGKNISVLAGVYNTDTIRHGMHGPLVRWFYHPKKTPAVSRLDAVRSLVSLPDSGTGGQADVLSLAFMINEAEKLARGSMIYMVQISDCNWVKSFRSAKSAKEEINDYFQEVHKHFDGRLHATLVALGIDKKTGLEHLFDKVIPINSTDLENPSAVASNISLYVASCMKEQRIRI